MALTALTPWTVQLPKQNLRARQVLQHSPSRSRLLAGVEGFGLT